MLEVAIGLVTVFLVLSVVTSALNEAWATWSSARGRILRVAIERLLGKRLAAEFYRQPRILALCGSDREVRQTWVLRWVRTLLFDKAELDELRNPPAYLEPATFAVTVLEQLAPVDGRDPVSRLVQLGVRAEALRQAAGPANDDDPGVGPLHALFHGMLQEALAKHPPERDGGLAATAALQAALEAWFTAAMDRTTGWYRRRSQRSMLVFATMVVFALNVDSLAIVKALYGQPQLRASLVQIGESMANQPGGNVAAAPDLATTKAVLAELAGAGLPLGWPELPLPAPGSNMAMAPRGFAEALFSTQDGTLAKWVGLLLSVIAASLGAPFWFQLLNRLVDLRGNGRKGAAGAGGAAVPAALAGGAPATAGGQPAPASVPAAGGKPTAPILDDAYWQRVAKSGPPVAAAGTFAGFTGVELATALQAARLAKLVYRDLADACRTAKTLGWTAAEAVSCAGTQVMLVADPTRVWVVYRGTEPKAIEDWITDAKFRLRDAKVLHASIAGRIHFGFHEALGQVQQGVEDVLQKAEFRGRQLAFVGHSLGGALATLHLRRAIAEGLAVTTAHPALLTFGCPRVGDAAFAADFDQVVAKARTLRFVNGRDLVTRVPARACDYDHVGRIAYFDDRGRLQADGADWFRWLADVLDATADFRAAAARTIDDHDGAWYVRRLEAVLPLAT